MGWSRRYSLQSYLRSALWVIPLGAYLASLLMIRLLDRLDAWLAWSWDGPIGVPAAQAALEVVITANLSFIVFTFSSLLVAIQVASAQLTPRIIATTLLRDNAIRAIVALLVFTLTFALGVLIRTETSVPFLLFTVAVVLGGISVVVFLFLIDYTARLMRPVSIVWRVGEEGLSVIDEVYPSKIGQSQLPEPVRRPLGVPERIVAHRGGSAIVLAVKLDTLLAEAIHADGTIEFAYQVGDFASVGEPLFLLYGRTEAFDERRLCDAVALGRERTIEQDATFAIRIIVDIAIKALSKAINDPTTAVLAIDQLHRLLRAVGRRDLHDDVLCDAAGAVRVVFKTPNWDDFVQLACREIRLYGAENYQVARRLRAMLENLLRTLGEVRRAALQEELDLLDQTLEGLHLLPQDLNLARVPDLQGLGGSSRS